MNKIIAFAIFVAIPIIATAESPVERQLSFHWDSLRFALGILGSDYYGEQPIIVLYKTEDGGVLMIYDTNKISSRKLSDHEVKSITSKISDFFKNSGPHPPPNTVFKPPALHMNLSIDDGFNRESYFQSLDEKADSELIGKYSSYISELSSTPK